MARYDSSLLGTCWQVGETILLVVGPGENGTLMLCLTLDDPKGAAGGLSVCAWAVSWLTVGGAVRLA